MSKKNKVNPGQYTQAGRLSPDDAARELRKTQSPAATDRSDGGRKAAEPGISNRESAREEEEERERLPPTQSGAAGTGDAVDDDAPAGDTTNEQASAKSGSRSGAQKAADSKYVNRPHPASEKTEGAFGRESGGSNER